MKVLVVGGGIGGLAAALAFHQRGRQVEVLERAAAFTEVGAGLTVQPNGLRALDALGLGDRVRAGGLADPPAGVRSRSGRWLIRNDVDDLAPVPAVGECAPGGPDRPRARSAAGPARWAPRRTGRRRCRPPHGHGHPASVRLGLRALDRPGLRLDGLTVSVLRPQSDRQQPRTPLVVRRCSRW